MDSARWKASEGSGGGGIPRADAYAATNASSLGTPSGSGRGRLGSVGMSCGSAVHCAGDLQHKRASCKHQGSPSTKQSSGLRGTVQACVCVCWGRGKRGGGGGGGAQSMTLPGAPMLTEGR